MRPVIAGLAACDLMREATMSVTRRKKKSTLEAELEALRKECGEKAEIRACLVLVEVVRWVRQAGHGKLTLSALDHLVGYKVRVDSVITVEKD